MKPDSINSITLPEAMELLASINHDPAWTTEQLIEAIAHFPDQKLVRIMAALEVVGTASMHEAHQLRTATDTRHSPAKPIPLKIID